MPHPQQEVTLPKVSLILPTYSPDNEVSEYVKRFLDTLKANTPRELYQFVVVENGSNTLALASLADIYIQKEYPLGYARAVNLGIALADNDLLVVANNDLTLPAGWLETMIEEYQKHGPGLLAPVDFSPTQELYLDSHWYSLWITDRHTWNAVGYFDEMLNYRFHDQDYSIKLKQAGFNVMRTGKVQVGHVNMATYKKMKVEREESMERELMRKRHGALLFDDWLKNRNLHHSV